MNGVLVAVKGSLEEDNHDTHDGGDDEEGLAQELVDRHEGRQEDETEAHEAEEHGESFIHITLDGLEALIHALESFFDTSIDTDDGFSELRVLPVVAFPLDQILGQQGYVAVQGPGVLHLNCVGEI